MKGKNASAPAFECRIPKVTLRHQPQTEELMSALTISKSGTERMQELIALGQLPSSGGASAKVAPDASNSQPNAAPATVLPTSMADLLKLRDQSTDGKDDKDDSSANQIQQQLVKLAADNALPTSGNIINTQA